MKKLNESFVTVIFNLGVNVIGLSIFCEIKNKKIIEVVRNKNNTYPKGISFKTITYFEPIL